MERALSTLERILPAAARLSRGVRVVSFVALAAAAVIALALFREGIPETRARALASVLATIAAFVPGAILFAFHRVLEQVLALPGTLRALPGTGRQHADELARLVRSRREAEGRPLRAWRLLALGRSSRQLLTPYAPLAPLLSVPFLIAAGLALVATPVLVVLALVALAVAA